MPRKTNRLFSNFVTRSRAIAVEISWFRRGGEEEGRGRNRGKISKPIKAFPGKMDFWRMLSLENEILFSDLWIKYNCDILFEIYSWFLNVQNKQGETEMIISREACRINICKINSMERRLIEISIPFFFFLFETRELESSSRVITYILSSSLFSINQ